jgi:SCP-2 sterol transfer family
MRYLSPEWLRAADDAVAMIDVDPTTAVVIEQRVPGGPDGDIVYRLVAKDGRCRLVAGDDPPADVSITTPWELANAIATGAASAQQAFLHGEIRIGGDPAVLVRHAELSAELSAALSSIA